MTWAVGNPGSSEAIVRGCTCPRMDNAHGKGTPMGFWINGDCPVHGADLQAREAVEGKPDEPAHSIGVRAVEQALEG